MINVVICEDQQKQLDNINDIVKKRILIQEYDMKVSLVTTSSSDVISYLECKRNIPTLFFLDIDLHEKISGIQLAVMIKEKLPESRIVFITTHTELSYLTFIYRVEAMDYIAKDDTLHFKERIRECVDLAYKRFVQEKAESNQAITIHVDDREVHIPINEVLYIESAATPHKLAIHLENRIIEYYGKIKEVEQINPVFVRSHQSYVLNIENVTEINKKERIAKMSNGEKCLISFRYLKRCIQKLKEYTN